MPRHDVFVSYAGEDAVFVRQLVSQIRGASITVWHAESELQIGDNLRRRIEEALVHADYGVVVLSPHFFAKDWPQRELDGLTALETADGRKRILPVWHGPEQQDVAQRSPMLANIYAANSREGVERVAGQIASMVRLHGVAPERFYEHVHIGESVDLVALARESGGPLVGHMFRQCRLIGPAVLCVGTEVTLWGLTFKTEELWQLSPGRPYVGCISVYRSRIEECTWEAVGFAGPAEFIAQITTLPSPE